MINKWNATCKFSLLNITLIFALTVSAVANFLVVSQSQMQTSLTITLVTAVTAIVVSWLISKLRR